MIVLLCELVRTGSLIDPLWVTNIASKRHRTNEGKEHRLYTATYRL